MPAHRARARAVAGKNEVDHPKVAPHSEGAAELGKPRQYGCFVCVAGEGVAARGPESLKDLQKHKKAMKDSNIFQGV